MKQLLAIEWLKIKRYRTFWVLIIMFVVLLPLWNYGINAGFMNFSGGNIDVLSKAYSFSNVWGNLGFWASIFVVFLSVLTIILTTNEYQYKTNRQNVIDGWTRLQFYHAKWFLVIMLSLATTLFVFLLGVVFALVNSGCFCDFPGDAYKLFYLFLLSLNYFGFGLLLSIFFKRSGITIGLFFLYCMIIESFIQKLINWKLDFKLGDFLPLQCSDELLPLPLIDMVKNMAKMNNGPSPLSLVIASCCWIFIYYLIGRRKLLRSDW